MSIAKNFGCAAMLAMLAAPAAAADIPMKAPMAVKAPIVMAYDWTGFYFGAHGGYAKDPASGTFNPVSYAFGVVPALVGSSTVLSGPGNIPLSVNPSGGFGGIQFGYNWQVRPWVFGWEADFSYGSIKDEDEKTFSVVTTSGDVLDFNGNVRLTQKVDYFGTLRARFGWANDMLLIFATGGLAWGHVDTTFQVYNVNITANGAITAAQAAALTAGAQASDDKIRIGYSVGGGFEWALNPAWSLRAEYLFIDLGNGDTLTIPGGTANSDFSMHLGRVALNYKFSPH